jgi:hypothetical protein
MFTDDLIAYLNTQFNRNPSIQMPTLTASHTTTSVPSYPGQQPYVFRRVSMDDMVFLEAISRTTDTVTGRFIRFFIHHRESLSPE